MPKIHLFALPLAALFLTTACHKTFMSDDRTRAVVGPVQAPKNLPADAEGLEKTKAEPNILTVDCTFTTTTSSKLQLILDTTAKAETIVGISIYDTGKGQSAESEYATITTQKKSKKEIIADYKGESVNVTLGLFKKGEKTDVLVGDEDVYHCDQESK